MDYRAGPALPDNNALNYEKFPGFKETLKKIRDNEQYSFSVEFPDEFDMSGEFLLKYPDGTSSSHSMTCIFLKNYAPAICYHPYQVLELVAAKQLDFQKRENVRKAQEAVEDEESKKNIEDIKAKLAALDALEDDDED